MESILLLEEILEDLRRRTSSNSPSDSNLEEWRLALCETPAILQTVTVGLKDFSHEASIRQAAEYCAELAKSEPCRSKLEDLLPDLATALLNPNRHCQTSYQLYRAVGNICYENDNGREIVLNFGVIPVLLDDLQKWAATCTSDLPQYETSLLGTNECNLQDSPSATEVEGNGFNAIRMTTVILGCFCNLLENNIPCQLAALNSVCGILKIFSDILSNQKLASLYSLLLASLSSISENPENHKMILESPLPSLVLSVLKQTEVSPSTDDIEVALDFLTDVANADGGLLLLLQNGAISVLNRLLDREDHCQDVVSKAGTLLVELLADSQCVDVLSTADTEALLSSAASWLSNSHKATMAALIIGNLARNKENCEKIFGSSDLGGKENSAEKFGSSDLGGKENSAEILLETLRESDCLLVGELKTPVDPQLQLQYAVLSALKNLSVEENFRLRLVDLDLVKILLTTAAGFALGRLDKARSPVLAKLLTLLRMCASLDTKIAVSIALDDHLLELALHGCSVSAVARESIRLLILLLDASPSVVACLQRKGVVNSLVQLLAGDGSQQMAGLLLGNALFTSSVGRAMEEEIRNSEFFSNLKICLSAEKTPPAVLLCGLQLLEKFADSSILSPVLTAEILPLVEKFRDSADEKVRLKADSLFRTFS